MCRRDLDVLLHILIGLDEYGERLREIPTLESVYFKVIGLSEFSGESVAGVCRDDRRHTSRR